MSSIALIKEISYPFQLGSLLPVTTPAPPTTSSPQQLRPPFESSNLINHISKPADVSNVSTHYLTLQLCTKLESLS